MQFMNDPFFEETVFTGWGSTSPYNPESRFLQKTNLRHFDHYLCEKIMKPKLEPVYKKLHMPVPNKVLTPHMLCMIGGSLSGIGNNTVPCMADRGGGLIWEVYNDSKRSYLVGIATSMLVDNQVFIFGYPECEAVDPIIPRFVSSQAFEPSFQAKLSS